MRLSILDKTDPEFFIFSELILKGKTMRRLNPAYLEAVTQKVNLSPYFELISMEVTDLELGESRLKIAVNKKHLQPFGNVHGGVFSSLVDAAAFWAVYPEIEEEKGLTTVEMKLNYLAPASKGVMLAKGRRMRRGPCSVLYHSWKAVSSVLTPGWMATARNPGPCMMGVDGLMYITRLLLSQK